MMLLASTTQPVWTPEAVESLIKAIAYILIPAFAVVLIPAVIGLLQAIKAVRIAERTNATSEANTVRTEGLQQQVTSVAMNQTPPATPATPPASSPVEWVRSVPPVDRPKGT